MPRGGRNEKHRILFIADASEGTYNAQNLNTREIVARLDPALFAVTIFNEGTGAVHPAFRRSNVTVVDISDGNFLSSLKYLHHTCLRRSDTHFYIRTSQPLKYWWLKKLFLNGARTVHVVENTLPYPAGERYNAIATRNAIRSDAIVAITQRISQQVKEHYDREIDALIHVGVDLKVFTGDDTLPENPRPRIVAAGTFQPRKRPLFFCETARRFPQADFIWIGKGELKERCREFCAENRLTNVSLLDSIPHTELARQFRSADICFFPSLHEGFPKTVIEAMACGLPAIVFSDYGPENVEDGISGFIVDDDPTAWERIELLLNDRTTRERMGQAAGERAKLFDWDTIVEQWQEFLLA